MSPRTRLILYTLFGAVIAIVIGVDIANESYGLAVFIALFSAWLVVSLLSAAAPDSWLLAVALVGYLVGNRGFAQMQPTRQIPLLPAEAVLLAAVPALVIRMVLKRTAGIRRDLLNYSVLAWMAIGAARLPLDMHRFGVIALRDFAMIYYAAFFFVAQAFGAVAASENVLRKALSIAFLALMPVVVSILISPDFLVEHLTFRGIPIIYQKSDLIATYLAAGHFWLWTRWNKSGNRVLLASSVCSLLLIGAMGSPRAAMFAASVTTLLWVCRGRWRIAAAQIGSVAAAAVIGVGVIKIAGKDLQTSIPYSVYEHALSIFDPAGSGSYINGESGNPGDNNRFRVVWWRDVIEDTVAANPALGLGFGADLSARFLADYELLLDETFAARSPHSMVVTVFGRMGLVGLAAWIGISATMIRMVWRLLGTGDPDGIGFACVSMVVWTSACFGVVLEGPMGAVIFWSALGLANSRLHRGAARERAPAMTNSERVATGDWPVAKTAALGTQSLPR